jgi:hypothetical protein
MQTKSKSNRQSKTYETPYPRSLRTRNKTRKAWHLHPHTKIQAIQHTSIAYSKRLPYIKSTKRGEDRQRRSELPYHTSRQEQKEDATHVGAAGTESAGDASWLSGGCPFVIPTAQPSRIQKRSASQNQDKKHQNNRGVALAANGTPTQNLLYP